MYKASAPQITWALVENYESKQHCVRPASHGLVIVRQVDIYQESPLL